MVGFDKYSQKLKGIDYALAGAASGFITRALCQPFDVLKIRFQLQVEPISKTSASKYQSVNQALVTIWKEEGWRSFWKGHVPAQMLSITYGLTQFWVFETLTKEVNIVNASANYKSVLSFAFGSVAGVTATVVSFPFDVLRTRLVAQSEQHKVYFGVLDAIKQIYKHESKITFFRGLFPTLLQVAPHVGIQFMCYNIFDTIYRNVINIDYKSYTFSGSIVSGSLAGLCAKTAVYPFDLARKRLQIQGFQENRRSFGKPFVCKSLSECLYNIFKYEGTLSLFKGLCPSLIKAVASSALHFSSYELICKLLDDTR